MRDRFDYKKSVNNIKANLFDIYENQEEIIGSVENEEQRNLIVNNFIELKNSALVFLSKIESLYEDSLDKEEVQNKVYENQYSNEQEEYSDNLEENNEEVEITEEEYNDNQEENNQEVEETSIEDEDKENTNNESVNQELPRYYLTCDFSKVNFAYVPQNIYDKIRNHKNSDVEETTEFKEESSEDNIESTEENKNIDNHFYKQDLGKTRGIIVRSDQYMKLALSRHRQAGVLEEAKEYRKEEVRRRQRENQKRELEKAKLRFDI